MSKSYKDSNTKNLHKVTLLLPHTSVPKTGKDRQRRWDGELRGVKLKERHRFEEWNGDHEWALTTRGLGLVITRFTVWSSTVEEDLLRNFRWEVHNRV